MQTWSGSKIEGTQSSMRRLAVYTLLVFSLAGLIAGFAFGGFSHPGSNTNTTNIGPAIKNTPLAQQHTITPTLTTQAENVQLDIPKILSYKDNEQADGSTTYTLAAQIIDKSTKKLIIASDVTCRLWITKDAGATDTALRNNNEALPKAIASITQPFPSETTGALTFASTSPQVQPCVANGQTSWTYTLATTVQAGNYYLYILADWKGYHYNWVSRIIAVSA